MNVDPVREKAIGERAKVNAVRGQLVVQNGRYLTHIAAEEDVPYLLAVLQDAREEAQEAKLEAERIHAEFEDERDVKESWIERCNTAQEQLVGYFETQAALQDARTRAETLEAELRREWWTNHGCDYHALYGDDGEMACNRCLLDFKRQPVDELREGVTAARLARAAALPSGKPGT